VKVFAKVLSGLEIFCGQTDSKFGEKAQLIVQKSFWHLLFGLI